MPRAGVWPRKSTTTHASTEATRSFQRRKKHEEFARRHESAGSLHPSTYTPEGAVASTPRQRYPGARFLGLAGVETLHPGDYQTPQVDVPTPTTTDTSFERNQDCWSLERFEKFPDGRHRQLPSIRTPIDPLVTAGSSLVSMTTPQASTGTRARSYRDGGQSLVTPIATTVYAPAAPVVGLNAVSSMDRSNGSRGSSVEEGSVQRHYVTPAVGRAPLQAISRPPRTAETRSARASRR